LHRIASYRKDRHCRIVNNDAGSKTKDRFNKRYFKSEIVAASGFFRDRFVLAGVSLSIDNDVDVEVQE